MKRFLPVILVVAAVYLYQQFDSPGGQSYQQPSAVSENSTAFRDGQQAKGSGTVVRILSDDSDGSRHQRFILRIAGGRALQGQQDDPVECVVLTALQGGKKPLNTIAVLAA